MPVGSLSLKDQLQEIFSGIRDILCSKNASILQERIFGVAEAMETAADVRSEAYGNLVDGVAPSFLVCKQGSSGPIAGVQVYALSSDSKPEVVSLDGTAYGRSIHFPDLTYLVLSGLSADECKLGDEQSQVMLEKAESLLKQAGGDLRSVARTWMWLKDILCWYDDFNRVRNDFFSARGIIGPGSRQSMPASTGIGLGPWRGGWCSMDLTAIIEPADSVDYLQAIGKQQCALEYGSAFSRAAKAATPAGETVFISGTASIDACGATTNLDDARAQITTTIENVRAVLSDMDCRDEDVVQVMAYCKSAEVEQIFNSLKDQLKWPWVPMICDVCRDDLLFEIEAAAIPRSN